MKFANAFNKLIKGKEITRSKFGRTNIAFERGRIIRKKKDGATSDARLGSEDLLADDWTIVKK